MKEFPLNSRIFLMFIFVFLFIGLLDDFNLISDEFSTVLANGMVLPFFMFLSNLVAQRGTKVGYKYLPTFLFAIFALPITAFVVWIVKKPAQPSAIPKQQK